MQYGAKGARFAPFAKDYDPSKIPTPTYDTTKLVSLSPLARVDDSPTFNTVKAYGDDHVTGQMSEFKECPITVEVNDLPNETAAVVLGCELDESTKELKQTSNDSAPYGGFAYHIHVMLPDQNNKKVWRSRFYPQVQAMMQGVSYATKGDSIVLANERLMMNAIAAKDENWVLKSPDFDTEDEAVAWENAKYGVTGTQTTQAT